MKKIEKYIAKNGVEFQDKEECEIYEKSLVDKNGRSYKKGDWIKESWHFHGFCGSGSIFDAQEYVDKDLSFRFVRFDGSQVFEESRVNRQGWPISSYEIEVVNEDYIRDINKDPSYGYSGNRKYGDKPYYYSKGIGWVNYKNRDWVPCKNELGEERIKFDIEGEFKFKL